jgi:hypothetical protein
MICCTDTHAGRFAPAEICNIRAFEYHIPVHEKEWAGHQIPDGSHSIGCPVLVALRCIGDSNPEFGSIPEMRTYFPLSISHNKDKILNSGIPGGKNKVFHHRAVRQGKHHLRTFRRQGAHPLSLSCSENDTFHIYSSSCNI